MSTILQFKEKTHPPISLSSHLQLHSVYGIQNPAHCAVTPTHQHPDTTRRKDGAQLERLGGSQLRQIKHLEEREERNLNLNSSPGFKSRTTTKGKGEGWFSRTNTNEERLQTDLHRVEEGAKLSQQSLPHVVTAPCVSQDQHWSPATAAGRRQLQKHKHTIPTLLKKALGHHIKPAVWTQVLTAAPKNTVITWPPCCTRQGVSCGACWRSRGSEEGWWGCGTRPAHTGPHPPGCPCSRRALWSDTTHTYKLNTHTHISKVRTYRKAVQTPGCWRGINMRLCQTVQCSVH